MTEPTVKISLELPEAEALAFAQFLKRAGHGDYRNFTRDDEEAYQMLYAANKLRAALAEVGFAPR